MCANALCLLVYVVCEKGERERRECERESLREKSCTNAMGSACVRSAKISKVDVHDGAVFATQRCVRSNGADGDGVELVWMEMVWVEMLMSVVNERERGEKRKKEKGGCGLAASCDFLWFNKCPVHTDLLL